MSKRDIGARSQLNRLGDDIQSAFASKRRVMAFAEYLELVADNPTRHLRSAPQVLLDCFDYFGREEIVRPWGSVFRYRLFDCPWADGRDRLVGQEEIQGRVYRVLKNFVREGAANKLVLLHGPNGSAKSTLVRCLGRALQSYSNTEEGALYRFNWIFPATKVSKSGIGFSGEGETVHHRDSYAYLDDDHIDAKLVDEQRDHPMFLVPRAERETLMREWIGDRDEFVLSDYLLHGELSHRNRAIYEALLASYQGNYLNVLRHVQVERFFVRHRYREGYTTVEPQLSVDAAERQITADRSVSALPPSLQSLTLFSYGGELVEGNRGLIEYSDLLKRPLEAYKYLLTTVERASVSLQNASLFLDLVFFGTSNEIHLQAFKEVAEFQSFRGRIELVRAPYLLDVTQEEQIYAAKIKEASIGRHVAPHCAYVTALWAVLTRMKKPLTDLYPQELREVVDQLGPLEKAELYAFGKLPDRIPASKSKELLSDLGLIWRESEGYPNYEGRTGASPRELQTVVLNAANSPNYDYVSPLAVLDEIEELTKQTSVYEFLKQDKLPGGFHDHRGFVTIVRDRLLDKIDDEFRSSMGMVEEKEYARMFERYVVHVLHWTRKEQVKNATTGDYEPPDQKMMSELESTLDVDDAEAFRHDLISRIGAWSLDNPDRKPVYSEIFADLFRGLKNAYFEERRNVVKTALRDAYHLVTGNASAIADDARVRAQTARDYMVANLGYNEVSARDAIVFLVRHRYQ